MTHVGKAYFGVSGERGSINLDVYPPGDAGRGHAPIIIVVSGGGGKDALTGGKHAAGYHDLAVDLSSAGLFVLVPSRRGDPERSPSLLERMDPMFKERLPRELLEDNGPNSGPHSHLRHVEEIADLLGRLTEVCGPGADISRVGLIGKSAGGGVALRIAAESADRICALALWGCALRTSQWFAGPKADTFFKDILDARRVRYDREQFLDQMCDAIDYVPSLKCPTLFACAAPDQYAPVPPEPDKWSDAAEQLLLQRYAINCRDARVSIIKGAEHTMYREHPAWERYAGTLRRWFVEHLVEGRHA